MNIGSSEDEKAIATKTTFGPIDPKDPPSFWRKFCDGIRRHIGLKPLHLAEAFTQAKITRENSESAARLLEAKAKYETAASEARAREIAAAGEHAKDIASARLINTQADAVQILLDAARADSQELLENVKSIIGEIRMAGGDVEMVIAPQSGTGPAASPLVAADPRPMLPPRPVPDRTPILRPLPSHLAAAPANTAIALPCLVTALRDVIIRAYIPTPGNKTQTEEWIKISKGESVPIGLPVGIHPSSLPDHIPTQVSGEEVVLLPSYGPESFPRTFFNIINVEWVGPKQNNPEPPWRDPEWDQE